MKGGVNQSLSSTSQEFYLCVCVGGGGVQLEGKTRMRTVFIVEEEQMPLLLSVSPVLVWGLHLLPHGIHCFCGNLCEVEMQHGGASAIVTLWLPLPIRIIGPYNVVARRWTCQCFIPPRRVWYQITDTGVRKGTGGLARTRTKILDTR